MAATFRSHAPKNPRFDSEEREEFERRMIGALLCAAPDDPALVGDVLALCPKGSVVSPRLTGIWDAVCGLHAAGRPVDCVTVWDWLDIRYMRRESSEKPDAASIAELMQTIWQSRDHALHFAGLIRNVLDRQALSHLLAEGASECLARGADIPSIMARLRRGMDELAAGDETAGLGDLLERVIASVENGSGARPVPSPWPNLNAVLKGGAAPGELVVLAGRPGLGKTALAGCWAVETARRVGPVLFVSCEVKAETLGARFLAREGRIDKRAFRQGLGESGAQLSDMRRAADALRNLPLRVVDSSRRSVRPAEVRRLAGAVKGGVALVVVDYLQLMCPDDRQESREREIADMSRAMKRMAVELNCPVLLLSQLNRKAEDGGREPQLADIRESGAVEQDADIVIMLHSERERMAGERCPVKALVRKGRSSGTGAAELIFDKAYSDFSVDSPGRALTREPERAPDNEL